MPMVTKFEDLSIWQKARSMNKSVYEMTRSRAMSRDFNFVGQARSCSISTMNNIAEGFERFRRAEFLQFLSTAKGSNGELRSMLYAALDVGYITEKQFNELMTRAADVGNTIGRFRSGLERSTPKTLQ